MNSVSFPVALMCAIVFYVGLSRLFFYFIRKENNLNLFFAAVCLSVGLYEISCVGLYNSYSVTSGIFWQKCQYFTTQLIAVSFFYFTYHLIGRRRDWIIYGYGILMAVMFALGLLFNKHIFLLDAPIVRQAGIFFFHGTYYEAKPGLLMNILYVFLFIGMAYTFFLLIGALVRKHRKDLWPLIVGFCIFFITAVMDILIGAKVIDFIYTAEYSFLIIVVMMDYTLLRYFVELFQAIEELNVKLEEKVAKRTVEIRNMADEVLSINKELEEKNIILAELVERDSLTKLYNHAAFQKKLREALNLSRRHSFPFCVAMIDIDLFKKINDQYGHLIGDQVIQKVAEVLSRDSGQSLQEHCPAESALPGLRNYDVAARYGGDEFALLIAGCSGKEIKIIIDRICHAVRAIAIDACPDVHITLSIGVAVIDDPSLCQDGKAIIREADRALYLAKEQGRNRAVIAPCPEPAAVMEY